MRIEGQAGNSGPARPAISSLTLSALALIALTLLVFAPVRNFEFVSWDDPLYVSENKEVQQGLTWHGLQWAATTGQAANWHPVTWVSHMLDVELFGVAPGAHHATNLVIHTLNSVFLLLLLARMTGDTAKSVVVAALFAIHPQHVESVAWVAERKDVLSTMFGFLTMHAYVSWVRRAGATRYLLMALAFALALMSKPMLVTLPFLLVLFDIWPLRRLSLESGDDRFATRLWGCVREKLPLIVMAIALSVVTLIAQSRGGTISSLDAFPLSARLANIPVSYGAYLVRTFWPAGLAPFYPFDPLPAYLVVISIAGIVAISFLVFKTMRQRPYMLVGWLWYLGTLAPVIGLIQAGDQANADRYTYVPLLGVFFILVWGLWDLLPRSSLRAALFGGATILAIGALSLVGLRQVEHWKDSLSLWSHTATVTRGNYLAFTNLGFALNAAGRSDEALASFNEAVRARPNFAESRNALGVALMNRGRLDEAATQIREAIRIKPRFGSARNNLGMILATQGQPGEATVEFLEGLRSEPNNATIRTNLGMALAAQNRFGEAESEYRKALLIDTNVADTHNKLGSTLYAQGKVADALGEFSTAIKLRPGFVEARNNLGFVLSQEGRYDEALAQLREAIRIAPEFALAHNNLGIALSGKRLFAEAVTSFQAAIRLRPDFADARKNLEAALESQGTSKAR